MTTPTTLANNLKKKYDTEGELPRWPGVKYLTPEVSEVYQAFASKVARREGLKRVHLDAYLWARE